MILNLCRNEFPVWDIYHMRMLKVLGPTKREFFFSLNKLEKQYMKCFELLDKCVVLHVSFMAVDHSLLGEKHVNMYSYAYNEDIAL